MFYNVIYKNLSYNQKSNIIHFIKENFPYIKYNNLGMDNKTIIIINYENDKIIGCICLLNNKYLKELLINANANLTNYNLEYDNSFFLYNLCVNFDHRNKKIGNQLINEALELCKKINIDYIYCHAENEISRNLFLKNAFIEDKILNINNNNIYIMSKFI